MIEEKNTIAAQRRLWSVTTWHHRFDDWNVWKPGGDIDLRSPDFISLVVRGCFGTTWFWFGPPASLLFSSVNLVLLVRTGTTLRLCLGLSRFLPWFRDRRLNVSLVRMKLQDKAYQHWQRTSLFRSSSCQPKYIIHHLQPRAKSQDHLHPCPLRG
jgi:hypothetical protein